MNNILSEMQLRPRGVYCHVSLSHTEVTTTESFTLPGAWLCPAVDFDIGGEPTIQDLETFYVAAGQGRVHLLDKHEPLTVGCVNTHDTYLSGKRLDEFELLGYKHVEFNNPHACYVKAYNPVLFAGTRGMLIAGGIGTLHVPDKVPFATTLPLELASVAGWQFDTIARCWLFVPHHYRPYVEWQTSVLHRATWQPFILPVSHETLVMES